MRLACAVALGAGVVFLLGASALVYLRWGRLLATVVQVQRRVEALRSGRPYAAEQVWVPLARISDHLEHAVVAAEDSRFFAHHGIDWVELENAAREKRGRRRGASTITQQLIKNLFFTTHRSFARKLFELPLVWIAELVLPKRRILEIYLNVVEWAPGVYGAEAAARHHYGMSAAALERSQAARLAACLPNPLTRRPAEMGRYASVILRRMERMGW